MDILELKRMETSSTETIGILLWNKKIVGPVLEPPKKGNKTNISCIPTGQYMCEKYYSETFDCVCLSILSVHGREGIKMHPGNTAEDTEGCLLLGQYVGYLNEKRAVLNSRKTLAALIDGLADVCHLTIVEDF